MAPVTCSPNPTLGLYDATASGAVSGTTFNLTTFNNTSGPISVTLISGHNYEWSFTAGAGCGTNAADLAVTAQVSSPTPTAAYSLWGEELHGTVTNATTFTFGSFTPQSNLFVSSLGVSFETNFGTCSPNPTIELYDATASSVVSGTSVVLSGSVPYVFSGLSGFLFAGHQYQMRVIGGTGCGTAPINTYMTATYNVNNGPLFANNNLADVPNKSAALTNLGATSSATTPVINTIACIKTVGPPVVLGYCATAPSGGPPETCTCN